MSEPQNRTLNKIHDYLEGSLNEEQVDELWAELLSDDEAFDYMQTLAMLRKMERSEIRDPSSEPVPYELPRESRKPAVYFLRRSEERRVGNERRAGRAGEVRSDERRRGLRVDEY